MSRRYLTLCTVCDWHTGLLDDQRDCDRAYKAHACTAPKPPRRATPKPEPEAAEEAPTPPAPVPLPVITYDPPADRPAPTWNGVQLDDLDPDMPWQTAALCAQTDPELWFPEKGQNTAKYAKTICRRCSVRQPCLEEGLKDGPTFGVFGGLSERERRKFRSGHDAPRSQSA